MVHQNGNNYPIHQTLTEAKPTPIVHTLADGTTIYRGYAEPGTMTSAAAWKITKQTSVSDGASGTIVTVAAALGRYDAEFVWDDRLTYTYSR